MQRVHVSITRGEEEERILLMAWVYGKIAVHRGRTPRSQNKWAVTHLLCGRLVTHMDSEGDAKKVAEHLWDHHRGAFEERDAGDACKKVPQRVRDWCAHCRWTGKFVPYDEYDREHA